MTPVVPRVIFRAAAGPRLGFGHLVRCRSLARALGVPLRVSLRGTGRTLTAAAGLGCELTSDLGILREARGGPRVLVVDDPSADHAAAWVERARRLDVPVATVHDLGLGWVASDLAIDGSLRPRRTTDPGTAMLAGPAYAILDPAILRWREQRPARAGEHRILVALGGGGHVFGLAARLSQAIAERLPDARLRIATGLTGASTPPRLAAGEWITAPDGLGAELAQATLAVLAGGVTLYEACAIGVPAVAVALTPAQALTVRAVADAGAALDGGSAQSLRVARIAGQLAHLMQDCRARHRVAAAGLALVDGRGVFRVADRLRDLAQQRWQRGESSHAA